MPQEFSPKDEINLTLQLWWLIVIAMILGGLAGYVIHFFRPPIYQAKATLYTSIDFQMITDVHLSEYDEDMTINSVQSVMLSNDVIKSVLFKASKSDPTLNYTTFMNRMSIYRKFSDYEVFFRDPDPVRAQMIVNQWAETGIQTYQRLQSGGNLPAYINVSIGSLAELPLEAIHQERNSYLLAGATLGLVLGIFFSTTQQASKIRKILGTR